MKTKCILIILLVLFSFVGNSQEHELPPKFKQTKSNIVLILADDQMWDSLGLLENSEVITPNLDRLAAKGVAFSNAYNMCSYAPAVCVSSRTMLNTGAFLWRAEAFSKFRRVKSEPNNANNQTTINYVLEKDMPEAYWSQYIQQAGYETYFTGKWHVPGVKTNQA